MTPPPIALYFDPDAYTETHGRGAAAEGAPRGLMGRQVAGKEFLDAYLAHGRWDALTAVVRSRERAEPLVRRCQSHPASHDRPRRLRIVPEAEFLTAFAGASPPARLLHFPCPPEARFAWARHATGGRFALSGVTHTLSSVVAVQALCDLVIAPYESFDALICTSKAVTDMVKAVTGSYADYLRDRFGGDPQLRPRLATIPLGVDTDRFRPSTPQERAAERARIGARDDEVVILCVGRLSHHAKAHPFPAFHAAEQAARRTGKKVLLVFAGWSAHPAIDKAYRDGAARFVSTARVAFVDGHDPAIRSGVWHAADVVLSLPDNIQETFGLVVIEGMASGLPVVGADWDGYRDLIADGETGYLVPTRMVRGATAEVTTRHLFGQTSYDQFLAECSQAATVDPAAAADALTRLVADESLRRRMGAAGRERALDLFRWERVIHAYEELWAEQDRELGDSKPVNRPSGPATYAAPEQSFAGYPTAWLADDDRVQSSPGSVDRLALFLEMPLTNLMADRRCADAKVLQRLLQQAERPVELGVLARELEQAGTTSTAARATIAWLFKYDLLSLSRDV